MVKLCYLLAALCIFQVSAKSLPKFITKCRKSDAKLGECIKKQVEVLRPRLLKGIPELHIPPYDPIEIPQIELDQGTDAVKFKAHFTNVKAYGAKNVDIVDVSIDLKNPKVGVSLHFPRMQITTKYNISGKILLVPVQGVGISDGNFTDVFANATFTGAYVNKPNGQYIKLMGRKVSMEIRGAHMRFDNLFNGNQELTRTTNNFVNENWRDIVEELKPVLEETIGSIVFQLIEYTFDSFTLDELLLP